MNKPASIGWDQKNVSWDSEPHHAHPTGVVRIKELLTLVLGLPCLLKRLKVLQALERRGRLLHTCVGNATCASAHNPWRTEQCTGPAWRAAPSWQRRATRAIYAQRAKPAEISAAVAMSLCVASCVVWAACMLLRSASGAGKSRMSLRCQNVVARRQRRRDRLVQPDHAVLRHGQQALRQSHGVLWRLACAASPQQQPQLPAAVLHGWAARVTPLLTRNRSLFRSRRPPQPRPATACAGLWSR